jgi:mRNA-degrading endonuclease toxin of MazEF toxin-antitoxin module
MRIVTPMTSWQPRFAGHANKVRIPRSPSNGLSADSAADVIQTRSLALQRFRNRVGRLEEEYLDAVVGTLVAAIGFDIRTVER